MSLIKKASSETIDSSMSEVQNQIITNLSEPLTNTSISEKSKEQTEISTTTDTSYNSVNKLADNTEKQNKSSEENKSDKPKSRYSDTLLLNLPVGKRQEIKDFFQQYNLSMTQGILFGLNYLMEDVKSGRIEISKLGIERK